MLLFKKKQETPACLVLLYDTYKRACEDKKKCFYDIVLDKNKKIVEEFCKKNNLIMSLDHMTDGNLIYKFII